MEEDFSKRFVVGDGLQRLHPHLAKLPMIREILEGGIYKAHPSEPSLFTVNPMGLNGFWMEWLNFVLVRGVEFGEVFEAQPGWETDDPMVRAIALTVWKRIKTNIHSDQWVLLDTPPPVWTPNKEYLSMAWVLDTAHRDNMPLHEAVALGHSLLKG